MKKMIVSTKLGKYKDDIEYGQESTGDFRYYFVKDDGSVVYADLKDQLFAEMDKYLREKERIEGASLVNIGLLPYREVKRLLQKAIANDDQKEMNRLRYSEFFDKALNDLRKSMDVSIASSKSIHCSSNPYETYESEEFLDIEKNVIYDLGLYLDISSVRGHHGPIWFFLDPDHENDADMWFGDLDDSLIRLDFSEYVDDLDKYVFAYPESEWKERYRDYLIELCGLLT